MHWTGWIVVALNVLNGAWMAFDGLRALTTGDYVTPSSGQYAGQLGPWARLVARTGLDPRGTPVKLVMAGYGLAALIVAICFALQLPWAWWGMLILAVLGLWYLPFGTVAGLLTIVLLLLSPLRPG